MAVKSRVKTYTQKTTAFVLALVLCLACVPHGSFATDQAAVGQSAANQLETNPTSQPEQPTQPEQEYPYKSGYTQIDSIYAYDAAAYPYGSPVLCGGYDYDSGAWTLDTPTITEKGTQLQFEARGTYVSGNLEDPSVTPVIDSNLIMDSSALTWAVSDSSVATIDFQSGLFTPLSNGSVQVTATTNSAQTYDQQTFSVTFSVVVDINLSAYITGLTILAPDASTPISSTQLACFDLYQYLVDTTGETDFKTLAETTAPQFYVQVQVFDPQTEATSLYTVRSGEELAAQCGISDLSWGQVADSNAYSIDVSTGMLRMLYESTVNESIRVYTSSTETGQLLDDRATLQFTTGQDIGEDESGYIPSDTLTVMAYYEQYPADVTNPDSEYWLRLSEHDDKTSVTYSLSELQAISSRDQAYTMIGGNRSCQAIATGVNLMLLLQDALGPNVTVSDIAGFYFKTFDEGYMPGQYFVSASMLFSDRYFYPYYFQGGDLTGAQQVYPILAWSSKLYWSNKYPDINVSDPSSWDRSDMSSSSQYRLIFGANAGDSGYGVTKNSVYCIQTMYVVLKGGPAIDDGDGDGDGDSDKGDGDSDDGSDADKGDDSDKGGSDKDNTNTDGDGDGTDKGNADSDKNADNNNAGDNSNGNQDANSNKSGGNGNTTPTDASNKGNEETSTQTSDSSNTQAASESEDNAQQSDDAANNSGTQLGSEGSRSKQTIYQMMNKNELEVKLAVQNTLGWAVVPLGSVAFAAGGSYAFVWYRRQTRMVSYGANGELGNTNTCENTREAREE